MLRRAAVAVEAGFRLLARLRGAPALHPRGLTCAAELEVVTDGGEPWGVPWLDRVGLHEATVRLSRAGGLPRRLPDGLGLAVRVARADGPDRPLDLLLTSSGRSRLTRHLPLPRANALGGPYSSLVAYRVAGRSHMLAAFPRPGRRARVHGDPASLRDALAEAPLVFILCAAREPRRLPRLWAGRAPAADSSDRPWRPFAVLTVRTPLPVEREDSLGFDPYLRDARVFTPGRALAVSRRAAYRGSREGRGEGLLG
ncbi:phosphodiesterase [Streptomyces neyagawaensis]|uniref:Phosphodiesterase n=1 Tax=Streptomyces neyagawaensis TaxID=42238 RepID=A0ABV3B838_9ACTN